MIQIKPIQVNKIKQRLQVKKPWENIIVFILNLLIATPVLIIVHHTIVDLNWKFHLDRIILFTIIIGLIQILLKALKTIIILCVFFYFVVLIYGSLFSNYGFSNVTEDYRSMLYTMADNPNPEDIIISKLLPFPNKSKIIKAIDYDNPKVRNFALMTTTKYFRNVNGFHKYRTLIQCFAIFKEIKGNWNYVNDPKEREYIANASESIIHFSGDCEDHAILMAACVRAIGGTPRIINTGNHLYPEVLIGSKSDFEAVNFLVKEILFKKENNGKTIHYHIDERGEIWLNLDYTAKYPGGPFLSKEILGALTLY